MGSRHVQEGRTMEVVSGGAVAVDDIDVIGTGILGVALTAALASGDILTYGIKGVYNLVKVTGAVIAQGEQVLFDVSAANVDDEAATPATGDFLCGMAFEAAGSGVLVVAVDINNAPSAVT